MPEPEVCPHLTELMEMEAKRFGMKTLPAG
jgi:hypothetical protein